jgi:hypothetical protein
MHWEIEPPLALTKTDPELGQPSASSADQVAPLVALQLESSLDVLKAGVVSRLLALVARQTHWPLPLQVPPMPHCEDEVHCTHCPPAEQ